MTDPNTILYATRPSGDNLSGVTTVPSFRNQSVQTCRQQRQMSPTLVPIIMQSMGRASAGFTHVGSLLATRQEKGRGFFADGREKRAEDSDNKY